MKVYRRHLPHFHPSDAVYFSTFRLANSLPQKAVAALHSEYEMIVKTCPNDCAVRYVALKHYFLKFDQLLDDQATGHTDLYDDRIASLVQEAILYRDKKAYNVSAFCIMPNHVHLMFRLEHDAPSLTVILQSLKQHTAIESNKILNRTGAFWQHESYDHIVRGQEEATRIVRYIMENPVKAGLVHSAEEWKWSYFNCEDWI